MLSGRQMKMESSMKKSCLFVLFCSLHWVNANAIEPQMELLAGVEAGIDTSTAMTETDLAKTQQVLSSQPPGAQVSWFNTSNTTHYDLIINQYFVTNLRPCVEYNLTAINHATIQHKDLTACLNYDGNWISVVDLSK